VKENGFLLYFWGVGFTSSFSLASTIWLKNVSSLINIRIQKIPKDFCLIRMHRRKVSFFPMGAQHDRHQLDIFWISGYLLDIWISSSVVTGENG